MIDRAASPAGPDLSWNADCLVVFGITGDLARKMTYRALYRLEAGGHLRCPVVGVAKDSWTADDLRRAAREAIVASGEELDDRVFKRLAKRLSYLSGDFGDAGLYERLAGVLSGYRRLLFYLEVPPALFGPVVSALGAVGLTRDARVMVEKPFGHDLTSARQLDAALHSVVKEEQILRIDHFLGKEPVLDLNYLRFANSLLEPVWNRSHVAAVQVTMAEDFGVEDRGAFYDPVGALRDVVQNHLLQLVALVAMEPPSGAGADALRDRKVDVLRATAAVDPGRCVRGQYRGYRQVPGVKRRSTTETYVAMRLDIDTWRWAGVPFFLRAGKALAARVTEVRVILRRPPRLAFLEEPAHPPPAQVVLRVDPDPGLLVLLSCKGADGRSFREVHLGVDFSEDLGRPAEPYERLLHDALRGERTLFVRQDAIEESWRVLDRLLQQPPEPEPYEPGSWGPRSADALTRGFPTWQVPWLSRAPATASALDGKKATRRSAPARRKGSGAHG